MTARSTKSLFKATKAKPIVDPRQSPLIKVEDSVRPDPEIRRADDFYPTGQPEAIRALLAYEWPRLSRFPAIWEPSVGDGALARIIEEAGFVCFGSDLVDRGWPGTWAASYYQFATSPAKAIITNPPYSEINARDGHGRWLRHTLDVGGWEYCALLLGWDWPAAVKNGLGTLLDNHPFSYAYLMRWKLDFTGEGSPPQRNGWFIWDRSWTGPTEFRLMDRIDYRQQVAF